jgi:hypothetical protein
MNQISFILAVLVIFIFAVLIIEEYVPARMDAKQNARLDALEAAITCAQQPQERQHHVDDIMVVDSFSTEYGVLYRYRAGWCQRPCGKR